MLSFLFFILLFSLFHKSKCLVPFQPTVVDNSLLLNLFQLTWYDDFNTSTQVNKSKWTIQLGSNNGGFTTENNVFIQNNNLYLKQQNETCNTTGQFLGYSQGRINSQNYFGYGFFEAKIQFPNIPSWHQSFWLVGLETFPAPFFNQEIDIVEVNTYNMYYFPQHFHCWTNGTSNQKLPISNTFWKMNVNMPQGNYSSLKNWHIFGLHWNQTHIDTYLDGGRLLTTVYPSFIRSNPINILFTQYIWYDPRFPIVNTTSYMIVDYVSFYSNSADPNLCNENTNISNCIP